MIDWIVTNQSLMVDICAKVIAACAAIAAITPSRVDNGILGKLLQFVNLLGLNVARAKNADDV